MDDKSKDMMTDLLITEIRLLRQDIQNLQKDNYTLRVRLAVIAAVMGVAGGKISTYLPFLG